MYKEVHTHHGPCEGGGIGVEGGFARDYQVSLLDLNLKDSALRHEGGGKIKLEKAIQSKYGPYIIHIANQALYFLHLGP